MDLSAVSAVVSAISASKELAKAAIGVRDFNEMAPVIAQLNDQLLKAQDAMFKHNAQLMALQQENFEATEELRKMKEALAERGRYSLVELSDRVFVYRVNVSPSSGDMGNPVSTQPIHHLCQPCFDKGVKSVLQKSSFYGAISLECTICDKRYSTGTTEPYDLG